MNKKKKGAKSKNEQRDGSPKKSAEKARAKKTVQDPATEEAKVSEEKNSFFTVGMCASAGGLDAFEKFFQNMPPDSGMSFILVPHLDPTHKSMMVNLMKRCTKMEVVEAKDGMEVQPNNVYIIPPDKNLALLHRRLQLMEPTEPRGQRHPIDYFLRALATDQGERSICVILSGTGTDGTVGLKSIKEAGGMVIAQDPATAKYDGMPRSAIDTDLADYVLPPEKMPEQLIKYVKYSREHHTGRDVDVSRKVTDSLQKIFVLLRSRTGNDFSMYKKNTTMRRIERRMSVYQINKFSDYVRFLQENSHEIDVLFKELLIGVTNFFRDKEAFEVLKAKVCPYLFKEKSFGSLVRVWVVGCSTGEEAYSIAIALKEYVEEEGLDVKVQVFATDIDEDAIETARGGVYPDSIAVDISQERLKRFFVKEGSSYRVNKTVREMIIFATQNMIKDPPFSKLDMISCRNLLIYLDSELQKKILPLFHYALGPEGVLFLGSSETVGAFVDLFTVFEKKWKFFKRKESMLFAHPVMKLPAVTTDPDAVTHQTQDDRTGNKKEEVAGLPHVVERILLDSYAPPCVITNRKGDILYINGRTGKYLEPAPGEARMNVLEMAREGLKPQLQFAVRKCLSKNSDVVIQSVQVKVDGDFQFVDLSVKPVRSVYKEDLMMILFEDVKQPAVVKESQTGSEGEENYKRHEVELEQELKYTRENLQTTIEELETANEELKSTNEELQSANEELQSTNEELETAKEETQSLNEELVTVNSELHEKVEQLMRANNDMRNLFNSTHIATIFIDEDLKVRRFTPEASKVVNLIDSDGGRPISHIASNLTYENLIDDVREVLRSLVFVEREVQVKNGQWYSMKIMPYRTIDNVIDGVVITFVDIDTQKRAQQMEKDANVLASNIVDSVREPLVVLDKDLRVVSANHTFYNNFQVTKEETEGKLIYELGNRQWDIARLRELLEEILLQNTQFNDYLIEHEFDHIGRKAMKLNARCIGSEGKQDKLILLAIEDITERE